MSDRAPYSRVYWSIVDDPKFVEVYDNDRRLATWLRLLLTADQAHPASPNVPMGVHRASLKALVDCGLVTLGTGNRYRVSGLDKERVKRWGSRGTELGPKPDPDGAQMGGKPDPLASSRAGDTRDETRRDEQRRDEHNAREIDDGEAAVFSAIAKGGAFIRPDSPLGIRLSGLIDRQGADVVLAEMARLKAPLSDRQWVLGLENRLEDIPTGKDARVEDTAAEETKLSEKRNREVWKRRVEAYKFSGAWDEAWGPVPELVG